MNLDDEKYKIMIRGKLFNDDRIEDIKESNIYPIEMEIALENRKQNRNWKKKINELTKSYFLSEIDVGEKIKMEQANYESQPPLALGYPAIRISIPIEGDPNLFKIIPKEEPKIPKPNVTQLNPTNIDIYFVYSLSNVTDEEIASIVENETKKITSIIHIYCELINKEIRDYNEFIGNFIQEHVNVAIAKMERVNKIFNSINFEVKHRVDSPLSEAVNVSKKPIVFVPKIDDYNNNYQLDLEILYDFVKMIDYIGITLEQYPDPFRDMQENPLRNLFLAFLNGIYEGNASGETFSVSGRTDIVIKHKGKNVFVCECKIWGGPKYFLSAIKQLMGYLTWRDSKALIIIFNKNEDQKRVIESVKKETENHKDLLEIVDENKLIYKFKKDDGNNLFLSIRIYHIK